jgi:hypothetical protein
VGIAKAKPTRVPLLSITIKGCSRAAYLGKHAMTIGDMRDDMQNEAHGEKRRAGFVRMDNRSYVPEHYAIDRNVPFRKLSWEEIRERIASASPIRQRAGHAS